MTTDPPSALSGRAMCAHEVLLREERAKVARLTTALRAARDELGVPGPDYPAPVVNTVAIIENALLGPDGSCQRCNGEGCEACDARAALAGDPMLMSNLTEEETMSYSENEESPVETGDPSRDPGNHTGDPGKMTRAQAAFDDLVSRVAEHVLLDQRGPWVDASGYMAQSRQVVVDAAVELACAQPYPVVYTDKEVSAIVGQQTAYLQHDLNRYEVIRREFEASHVRRVTELQRALDNAHEEVRQLLDAQKTDAAIIERLLGASHTRWNS